MKRLLMLALFVSVAAAPQIPAAAQKGSHPALEKVFAEVQSLHPEKQFAIIVDGTFPVGRNQPLTPAETDINTAFADSRGLRAENFDDLHLCPDETGRGCHLQGDISAAVTFLVEREAEESAVILAKVVVEQLELKRIPVGTKVYRAVVRQTPDGWKVEEFELIWLT
jgi:hypothetical protein